MARIIDLEKVRDKLRAEEGLSEYEAFLFDEGLDLLSAYRLISDQTVRRSLLALIKAVAEKEGVTEIN